MLVVTTLLAAGALLWMAATAITALLRAGAYLRRSPADGAAAMEMLGPFLQRFSLFYTLPLALFVAQLLARATIRRHGSDSLKGVADRVDFLLPLTPLVCFGVLVLAVAYVSVGAQRAQSTAADSAGWRRSDSSLAFRLWMVLIALPIAVPTLGVYLFYFHSSWASPAVLLVLLCAFVLLASSLHPYLLLWGVPHRPLQDSSLEERARRMAEASHFPVASVVVIDAGSEGLESAGETAFVSGFSGRTRRIFLSDGLLRACPPEQVLAVLAHELAHVERGHHWKRPLSHLLFVGIAFGIVRAAEADWAGLAWLARAAGPEGGRAAVLAFLISGILLVRACQRANELEADRLAARRVGAETMARALKTLASADEEDAPRRSAVRRLLDRLLATHPPLEVRIQRLGLRPPGGPATGMGDGAARVRNPAGGAGHGAPQGAGAPETRPDRLRPDR